MSAGVLGGAMRVFVDTAPLIFFIEEHPEYLPLVEPIMAAIDGGAVQGISSAVTLHELLVKPPKEGRAEIAKRYRELLVRHPHFVLEPIDEAVAGESAWIRARFGFKPLDSIQLAVATSTRADAFITNDARLGAFDGVRIVILKELVGRG